MKNLNSTNKYGGKRQGAGKPALYGKAMIRKNVMLDPETIAFYTKIGKGNLSEGIRQHWRSLTKRPPDAAMPWACECDWVNNSDNVICVACGAPRR